MVLHLVEVVVLVLVRLAVEMVRLLTINLQQVQLPTREVVEAVDKPQVNPLVLAVQA